MSVPEEAMERFKEMKRLIMETEDDDSGKEGDSTKGNISRNKLNCNDKSKLELNLSAVNSLSKIDRNLGRPREINLLQKRAEKDHSADAFRGTTSSFPTPTTGRDKRSNTEHA